MPSLIQCAAVVAFAGLAAAVPNPNADTCGALVTGKAGLYDDNLRKSQCSSFIKTIVTPSPVVITTTITETPAAATSAWGSWGVVQNSVTVCPNQVPIYASACDNNGYQSACAVWGITGSVTTTVPASTTTKTVYVVGGNGGYGGNGGNGGNGGSWPSTTSGSSGSRPTGGPGGRCINKAKADEFVAAFTTLLEYTSYNGTKGPRGRGYQYNVSATYLAEDFQDYSDSINWMAGIPQGSVTFPSRKAFDYGQGVLQPELKMTTKWVAFGCSDITWGWLAVPPTGAQVSGINHMILTSDNSQIQTNYAEFNNGIWLNSFHIPNQGCQIPQQAAANSTSTTPKRM